MSFLTNQNVINHSLSVNQLFVLNRFSTNVAQWGSSHDQEVLGMTSRLVTHLIISVDVYLVSGSANPIFLFLKISK